MLSTVKTTRYIAPLREGGSLPALADADDGKRYVVKFRGAGQGRKALVAELLGGEIARALGLRVPSLALVELDASFGQHEGDPEIEDLLRTSAGLNLGLEYLPGTLMFDPLAQRGVGAVLASRIVWFDALILNVDRTVKNPNLLCQGDELWLIDHGAAFYFHHNWASDFMGKARVPFAPRREHVLLPWATEPEAADAALAPLLTRARLEGIAAEIPDSWLEHEPPFDTPAAVRRAYVDFLMARLQAPRVFQTP